MTPIAQLIAELRELANSTDRAVIEKECWEYADPLRRAAEALARQEELLAEAGKVVEPLARAVSLIDPQLEGKGNHHISGLIAPAFLVDADFRAAARLSDKLKGE